MINVIGIGPGQRDLLTPRGWQLIQHSQWLIGADRQLALFDDYNGQKRLLDNKLTDLVSWLEAHQHEAISVLASGDPMLYGIGKFLQQHLGSQSVKIVPGISSIQYLFSRIGLDMNDVYLTSSHGKTPDFDFIFQHPKVAMVTDDQIGPYQIDQQIKQRGLQRYLIIGENLSYPDERILINPAVIEPLYAMNVVVILNQLPQQLIQVEQNERQ